MQNVAVAVILEGECSEVELSLNKNSLIHMVRVSLDNPEDCSNMNFVQKWLNYFRNFWKQRRNIVSILALLGFFNVYALRVNLSIAVVAMTEAKNVTLINGTSISVREFDWDTKTQGYLLSSFFYGYITTQLLGGYFASRIGGKKVFGFGIAVTAALTLITPLLANSNVYLLIAVRIVEGIFEGVTYPCIHAVWAKWAPPLERSRLATRAFSGSMIGTIVAMPLSSYLAATLGWSSIFYFFGALGLLWCIVWMTVVAESPAEDPRISIEELEYIEKSINECHLKSTGDIPWKAIVTSLPVWAITVAHFCENWGFYTLLTQLPKFVKNLLEFDLTDTGFVSALPYLAMAVMMQFSGQLADCLQVRGIFTTTQVRKVVNCGAFIAQTVFMLSAAFWLSPFGTTFSLTVAVGLGSFAWAGFGVNHLDIAPQYASLLMGFGNTFATLPGIISPILTGYIVVDESDAYQWRTVFYVSSGIYLCGAIFYWKYASGEIQPWSSEIDEMQQANYKTTSDNRQTSYENKALESDKL